MLTVKMKISIAILVIIINSVFFYTPAYALLIHFDDLSVGNYGDNLKVNDVSFQSISPGYLMITDQTADGFGRAYSPENKLSVIGESSMYKEQTSFDILFGTPVNNFSFWITGTFHDTTITAFDEYDQEIFIFIQNYPMSGPTAPDGTPWDYYYDRQLRFINIDALYTSRINIQPSAYDGFSIDHLSYNPIPESSTILLFGVGFFIAYSTKNNTDSI